MTYAHLKTFKQRRGLVPHAGRRHPDVRASYWVLQKANIPVGLPEHFFHEWLRCYGTRGNAHKEPLTILAQSGHAKVLAQWEHAKIYHHVI